MRPGGRAVLIVDAEVDGRRVDVRAGATIEAVGPSLGRRPGEEVLDAHGGAVIPGLHDHHLHLRAVLAARTSVDLSDADAATALRAAADRSGAAEWIRATGYHEARAGRLDRDVLDAIVPERPVRVLQRTGEMWVLNSKAMAAVGADTADAAGVERDAAGRPTGRLFRLDAWLGQRIPRTVPDDAAWRALSDAALAAGVTGWTDATPDQGPDDLAAFGDLVGRGAVRQRLTVMSPPGTPHDPRLGRGPTKIVLDDVTLPTAEALSERIAGAHADGRPVAIHCVTLDQLSVALAAWEVAGAGEQDRIEHAAVVAPVLVPAIAALGVTVVTQPGFVVERGDDYLQEVAGAERDWLYPCASLIAAGVPVAGSTDAPHTDPDPWPAIAAAMHRRTRRGAVLGTGERLAAAAALRLFLGGPRRPGHARRIATGQPGDLVVLKAPLDVVLAAPSREAVSAVVMDGGVVTGKPE